MSHHAVILVMGRNDHKLLTCESLEKAKEWLITQLRLFYTNEEGLFNQFTAPDSDISEYVKPTDNEPDEVSTFGLNIDMTEKFAEFIVPDKYKHNNRLKESLVDDFKIIASVTIRSPGDNYPILFDNWTNGFDSQYVAFNPPDFHPDNRRTLLPHPAKTSKRWLTSFAHGYYASNFQYFISEPFPEHTCRDNPPITMMYYNVHEACDLLSRFGTVTLIGDSFTRHVWLALLHILTNNKRNGHLSKSSLSNPNHILCNYDEAYSERACRQLVANALDELHAPLCPNINGTYSMKYFDLATHPTQSHFYIVPDSLKPSLIIQANGAHDLGNEALRFPADTQKTYKDAQLYMVQQVRNQSQIMIYPLFLTPHNLITSESAPYRSHWNSVAKRRVHTFAPLMSDFFNQIGSDSKIIRPFPNKLDSTEDFFQLHLSKTNELVDEQHVHPWSILEMDRMSTNLPFNMSFDGHHYSSFVNTIKAQAILNFMHTILTELNI